MTSMIRQMIYKPKYVLIYLRKSNDTMYQVKKKTITKIRHLDKNDKGIYIIDIKSPAFIFENKFMYFLDYDTGNQLTYNEVKTQLTPEEADNIVGNKIIRELTAGVIDNKKEKIMYLAIGLIMGLLLGVVIMQFVMADKIAELSEDSVPLIPSIVPSITKWIGGLKNVFR